MCRNARPGGRRRSSSGALWLSSGLLALAVLGSGCRWIAGYSAASTPRDGAADAPLDAASDLLLSDHRVDTTDLIGPPPDMQPALCAWSSVKSLDGSGIDRVWVGVDGVTLVARGKVLLVHDGTDWDRITGIAGAAGDGKMVGLRGSRSYLYALHKTGLLWRVDPATRVVDVSDLGQTADAPVALAVGGGELFVATASTVLVLGWATPQCTTITLGRSAEDFGGASLRTLWHDGKDLWVAGSSGLLARRVESEGRWIRQSTGAQLWNAGWGQNLGLQVEVVAGQGASGQAGPGLRWLNGNVIRTDVDTTRKVLAVWGRSRFDVYAGGQAGLLKVLGAQAKWQPVPLPTDAGMPASDEIVDLWGNADTLVAGIVRNPPATPNANVALILRCQLR